MQQVQASYTLSDMEPHRHLEPVYTDNVKTEDRFLAEHPDWTLKRIRPEGSTSPLVTYEATDGVITLRSDDLGVILKLMGRAMQGNDDQ